MAPMSFSMERALVMDATYPFASNNLAAVYRKPDPARDKWRTYLRYGGPRGQGVLFVKPFLI